MNNLTPHGKKFVWVYINDYVSGKITEYAIKAYLAVCFEPLKRQAK